MILRSFDLIDTLGGNIFSATVVFYMSIVFITIAQLPKPNVTCARNENLTRVCVFVPGCQGVISDSLTS